MSGNSFTFKQFVIQQERCAMKVGTDGVLLGAWAQGGTRILDIGTGTALMALTSVEVILKNLQELFHKKEGGAA